jgi:hypothetical protein
MGQREFRILPLPQTPQWSRPVYVLTLVIATLSVLYIRLTLRKSGRPFLELALYFGIALLVIFMIGVINAEA